MLMHNADLCCAFGICAPARDPDALCDLIRIDRERIDDVSKALEHLCAASREAKQEGERAEKPIKAFYSGLGRAVSIFAAECAV